MERFDRLLEEQQKAITQTDEKIFKLQNFINEYEQLKERLSEISKCFSKTALIPFSPKALVPARFVHTNEVLVYLGGHHGHFCQVSTHQSLFIIKKRIERIQQDIKKLEDQRKLLTDRESFTQRLVNGEQPQSLLGGIDDNKGFEIREEFDPEKETEWLATHKENLRKERAQERGNPGAWPLATRHVHFQSDMRGESDSSDSSNAPGIDFRHSDKPSKLPNPYFTDWSNASPADVVAYTRRKNLSKECTGILKKPKSGDLSPTSSACVIDQVSPPSLTVQNLPVDASPKTTKCSALPDLFTRVVERNALCSSSSKQKVDILSEPASGANEHRSSAPECPLTAAKHPMSRFRLQKMSK